VPAVAAQLLANIPRMEGVREILRHQDKRFTGPGPGAACGERLPWGARLLKIALDWDALEAQGLPVELALQTLRGRAGRYDPELLDVVGEVLGAAAADVQVREVALCEVQAGMVFAEDVTTAAGVLLIARGQEVTPALVERIRSFSGTLGVREPVRMILGSGAAQARRRA
jgi:hypothetical protein